MGHCADKQIKEIGLVPQATPKSSRKGNYCRAKAAPKPTRRRREPTPPPELDNLPATKKKLNRQLTKAFK